MPSIPLTWSKEARRYRSADGRFIARAKVTGAIDLIVEDSRKYFREVSNQLLSGKIGVGEWQIAIKDRLRAAHTLSASIAGGGKDNMTPAKWGKLGANLREQYKYLERFALQLEAGRAINLGRVDLYARAIGITFRNAERLNYSQDKKYVWVQTSKEVCPGCNSLAGSAARRLEDWPEFGEQECLVNCLCFLREA